MAIERTLVQIRERSLLDLLDLSLVVVRQQAVTIAITALIGFTPFYLFNLWLFQNDPDRSAFYAWTVWMVEAPFATAPLTLVLGGLMFGQKPTLGKIVVVLAQSAFSLLIIQGILRFLLFFFLTGRLSFANEILLLERGRWWKILSRGSDLATGRGGELFALGLFQVVLTYAFAYLFFVGASRIQEALLVESLTWEVPDGSTFTSWRFQVPIWVVVGFFAIARFLTYIDQRIRLEGWEIELRLREVGDALQEARRW